MTHARATRIELVLLCVVVLGTAATSLDSTVTTDPDEVINPDWRQLPLSEDETGDIKEEVQASKPADAARADRPRDRALASKLVGQSALRVSRPEWGSDPRMRWEGAGDTSSDWSDVLLALLRALLPILLGMLALVGAIGSPTATDAA